MSDKTIQEIIVAANVAADAGVPVNWRDITNAAAKIFQNEYNSNQAEIKRLLEEQERLVGIAGRDKRQ